MIEKPTSCDTFVVLPPGTLNDCVIFGKNSDRPNGEVQEVNYFPARTYEAGSKLQCTYIEIDQAESTYAVILSKPSWMWGAEMGANEHDVCIGNEAVFTHLNGPDDLEERLLGMDLVRLGLERSKTAQEALEVITSLLEQYGQGGPCSDILIDFTYHNSFLIADRKEAWILETAGKLWAAEHVTSGCRNISNCLSIETKIDRCSPGLQDKAKELKLWDPSIGPFNFAIVFSDGEADRRYTCGKHLLEKLSASGQFSEQAMFKVLRDKASGICMSRGAFVSTGSQVSVLPPVGSERRSCHWFTATPDPSCSVFKPFIFCPNVQISRHIVSPAIEDDPAKVRPRFQRSVDRGHNLYNHHQKALKLMYCNTEKGQELRKFMRKLEAECIKEMEQYLENSPAEGSRELQDIFKDIVETEIKFYK